MQNNNSGGGFYVSYGALWTGITGWVGVVVFSTGAYFWAEHIVDRIEEPTETIIQYAKEKKKLDERWLELDTGQHEGHTKDIGKVNLNIQNSTWRLENKIDQLINVFTGQLNNLNYRLGKCVEGHNKEDIALLRGQIEKLRVLIEVR